MGKRSKSWSKWTPEVISNFMVDYPTLPWDKLEEKYSCPKSSLLSKASELGIKRRVGKVVKYTEEEDNIIRMGFENGLDDFEIGRVLGRSESSVRTRRERLGVLTRPGEWTEFEDNILREYYSVMPAVEVSKMLFRRSRNAVVMRAVNLGLTGYRPYHEYTEAEELFIKNNYLEMTDYDMGVILGHSKESIKNRRNRLGLHRPKDRSKYSGASEFFRKYNTDWKRDSMIACEYKCAVTGNRFDDIHHLMSLNKILEDACLSIGLAVEDFDPNYASDDEKSNFVNAVKMEQAKYPLGVCLSKEVHTQFHNIYGYGDNTPDQFYQFISEYHPYAQIKQTEFYRPA